MRNIIFLSLVLAVLTGVVWKNSRHQVSAKIITVHSRGLVLQEVIAIRQLAEKQSRSYEIASSSRPVGTPRNDSIFHGTHIYLSPELPVTISDGGKIANVTTTAGTVGDLLERQNITLAATDRVTLPLQSYLYQDLKVQIDRIVDIEETVILDIAFGADIVEDPTRYYGQEEIVEAGILGKQEKKYIVTYRNGIEIHRKKLSERILEQPKTEIKRFGTLIEVAETVEGRASWYNYKKCMCAAAPFYPRGRYVRVTSPASGKSIIVKINDSGPDTTLYPERVIDLDIVAYRELASPSTGTIAVRVELLRQ